MGDLFFGVGGLACGIYCIYSAVMMQKTGVICATLLLDKRTAKETCSDVGGFLVEVIPPTYGLGVATLIYGIVTLVDAYLVECEWIMMAVIVLAFAVLVWFGVVTSKSKKKYF